MNPIEIEGVILDKKAVSRLIASQDELRGAALSTENAGYAIEISYVIAILNNYKDGLED